VGASALVQRCLPVVVGRKNKAKLVRSAVARPRMTDLKNQSQAFEGAATTMLLQVAELL
jgi:hypothetical protein